MTLQEKLIQDLIKLRTYYHILIDLTNKYNYNKVMLDADKLAFKMLLESDLRVRNLLMDLGIPNDESQYDFEKYSFSHLLYKQLNFDVLKSLENNINIIKFEIQNQYPQHLIKDL